MKELIDYLKSISDEQLCKNLLLIAKQYNGKLRKFNFSQKNYKLLWCGDIKERELVFWHEVLKYKDKYSEDMLLYFYTHWSENTQNGKKMLWEEKPTWETGKRLALWYRNSKNWNKQ